MRPVAVVGPTATGKSALGLALAEHLGGEIVNVDSMQLYRGMDIGTAKTPDCLRRGVPHHLLDVLAVTETATVARYQGLARAVVEDLLARGVRPVLVGGSGLYVQALLDDVVFPATDAGVRARWEARLAEGGSAALHAELARLDPAAAAALLPSDGRRLVRALEVVEITGQPFRASAPTIGPARWDTLVVGLDRDTAELDARIAARTEQMFAAGLVAEVQGLVAGGLRDGVTARRALGYAQVIEHLDGELELDEARLRTTTGTRRYVRRQRSWFRRDRRVRWFDAAEPQVLESLLATLGA